MSTAEQASISSITSRLQDGDSPLDFIKKNMEAKQYQKAEKEVAAQEAIAPAPVKQLDPFAHGDPYDVPKDIDTSKELEGEPESKEDKETTEGENPKESSAGEDGETPIEEKKKKPTKEDSVVHLRKIVEATKAEKEAVAAEKLRLEEELENVKAGFVPNEKVEQLEARIQELEVYEAAENFKNSREFKEKFQSKMDTSVEKARQLAAEYNVDRKVLDQAIRIPNKIERKKFLLHYFGDEMGAFEANQALEEIQNTHAEIAEAQKTPKQSIERLRQELADKETKDQAARIDNLIKTAKDSWKESLKEVEDVERFPELNFKPNDVEHNKIVAPIIEEAAKEYGKFVTLLGAMGIKELPKDVQKMLARTFKLSRAYAVVNESRNQYSKLVDEITSTAAKKGTYRRPGVGGSMPGITVRPTQEKAPLPNRLDDLISSVKR